MQENQKAINEVIWDLWGLAATQTHKDVRLVLGEGSPKLTDHWCRLATLRGHATKMLRFCRTPSNRAACAWVWLTDLESLARALPREERNAWLEALASHCEQRPHASRLFDVARPDLTRARERVMRTDDALAVIAGFSTSTPPEVVRFLRGVTAIIDRAAIDLDRLTLDTAAFPTPHPPREAKPRTDAATAKQAASIAKERVRRAAHAVTLARRADAKAARLAARQNASSSIGSEA